MTRNKKKYLPTWTDKHDAFCLKNKLTPCTKLLWKWLIREGQGQEIEPDLADFNNWVAKHREKGKYSRNHLKAAFKQLIDCKIIHLVKQYTWRIVKCITRPLSWLRPKKNLQVDNNNYASHTSNPSNSKAGLYSSSSPLSGTYYRDEITKLCKQHGIKYHPEKPCDVYNHSLEEIEQALKIFYQRGGHEKIINPPGFILDCLMWRYWEY